MATFLGCAFPFQKSQTEVPASATDDVLIQMSIIQILLTGVNERVMRPGSGCGVMDYVFSPNDDATQRLLEITVRSALAKQEPRISVTSIQVAENPDDDTQLVVTVKYVVLLTRRTNSVSVVLPTLVS